MTLRLISHALCPYVQRAVIALSEKAMPFERIDIDLADKPDWFRELSPLAKTPVLIAAGRPIFESAVIVEYLEDVGRQPLHPHDPLDRARHRAWIEVASSVLTDIAGLYSAPRQEDFARKATAIHHKLTALEAELGAEKAEDGPWFDGARFSLVDAAFAPVFRYFDAFDRIGSVLDISELYRVGQWRRAMAARPSVRAAVAADYPDRLDAFLRARGSHLSARMAA